MDWTDFSDPLSGFDLVINAVKQTHAIDVYLNKKKFTAVALTRGEPLTPATGGGSATYMLKARILGSDSPHQLLPDPCLLSEAGNSAAAVNAINQHTTFVGSSDPTSGTHYVINPGDLIEVELDKGLFSYNLERGRFMRVVQSVGTAGTVGGANCGEVSLTFSSLEGAGNVGPPGPSIPGVFTHGPLPEGQYTVTSVYQNSRCLGGRCKAHKGTDYGAPTGTKVFAVADGTIIRAVKGCPANGNLNSTCGGGYGNVVYIEHHAKTPAGESIYSVYAHLSKNVVSVNQTVKAGDHIGDVGNSGRSTGPHLHLEIHLGRLFGTKVNPQDYLESLPAAAGPEEQEEDHELGVYEDPPGVEGVDWEWTNESEGEWVEL